MSQKKKTTGAKLDKVERERLKLADFLGELTEAEIPIAKKHGLLAFDLYQKATRLVPKDQQIEVSCNYHRGMRLAPQFGPDGKPLSIAASPEKKKYLIRTYEDLKNLDSDDAGDRPAGNKSATVPK